MKKEKPVEKSAVGNPTSRFTEKKKTIPLRSQSLGNRFPLAPKPWYSCT